MRIFITITEEPVFITPFIQNVISQLHSEIVGIGIVKGSALKTKKRSGIIDIIEYAITILMISNIFSFFHRVLVISFCKFMKLLNISYKNPYSIEYTARKYNIPIHYTSSPNHRSFLKILKGYDIDIIINQAQAILKKNFLDIPKIGSINRHAALLPRYRGRLAPFWAYMNMEKHTGISIHFIEPSLDSGDIIVQKKIPIQRFDSLESLLKKIFACAPDVMVEAINKLRGSDPELIENNDNDATYFTRPSLKDACKYRMIMIRRMIFGTQ